MGNLAVSQGGKKIRKLKRARFSDYFLAFICILVIVVCLFPMISLFSRSVSDPKILVRNEVTVLPKGFNLDAYKTILTSEMYTRSLGWTAILTAMCVLLSMFMTVICAYPLIYDHLKGRKFFNAMYLFTMYFGAGTIPTYLLLQDLKLINSPLVLMLPFCLSVFNVIIMRSFLFGIPDSLRESAEIDGAGPIRILVRIYLPLCTSVIATLSLFYAVGRWNGYSDALMFMNKNRDYFPIQYLLYNIINNSQSYEAAQQEGFSTPGLSETFKAASVMFATVPILIIYPFMQRYFIHGVTIGAEKG